MIIEPLRLEGAFVSAWRAGGDEKGLRWTIPIEVKTLVN
jgi:hypothetical protein